MGTTDPATVRHLGSNPEIAWSQLVDLIDELQSPLASAVHSADGAITIKQGSVIITKSSGIAALTLAAPTATTDDGKVLRIVSVTARAHTITTPSSKLNGSLHIATLGGAIGDAVTLIAYQGIWYTLNALNATIS